MKVFRIEFGSGALSPHRRKRRTATMLETKTTTAADWHQTEFDFIDGRAGETSIR
jgi:hypothetical protein